MHDDFSVNEFDFLIVRHLVAKTLTSFGLVAQTIHECGGDFRQSRRFQNRREIRFGGHGREIMTEGSRQTSRESALDSVHPMKARRAFHRAGLSNAA
jgi:hypothetical protein